MNKKKREKQLQIVVFVLIAIITLGIGYTAISSIILTITGHATADVDDANFKVHFDRNVEPTMTVNMGSAYIDTNDDKVASIEVTGLTKIGDSATAEYTIINESNGIGAQLSLDLVNTNTEYFKVTETIDDIELKAGESTKARVTVELLEVPVDSSVTTDITGTIEAKAIRNKNANSTEGDEITKPSPNYFATDSWEKIQTNVKNNKLKRYNIGDTKTVTINGNDYTVRVANKTISEKCSNENYSQTACGFVVEFVDIIEVMKMSGSGYYANSLGDDYLQNTLYNQLPEDLKNVILSTKIISEYNCQYGWTTGKFTCNNPNVDENNYILDAKLYLLSPIEVFGPDSEYTDRITEQLDYYKDISIIGNCNGNCPPQYDKVKKQYNNENYSWWTRSFQTYDRIVSIGSGGTAGSSFISRSEYGISPAFRIG